MHMSARRAILVATGCVLAGNVAFVAVRGGSDSNAAPAAANTTTTTAAIADSPVFRPPVSVASPMQTIVLPQPENPPDDPYAPEPEIQLGRLEVPAIGLDTTFYDGVSLVSIDRGPSHWPGSAMPGQLGNVVVAGHRVTHTRPFRNLDQLKAGDQAIFTTPDGTFTYDYVSTEIVDPTDTNIVNQTLARTATFFACHPPGSARSRIVVHWQMVGDPGPPSGAGSISITGG